MYEIPAYLVWGFLESGKSTLIKETLSQDYFNDGEKTMILTFEEGEVEYDKEMLEKTNSFVINIEKIEDFTKEFVRACQRNYYPDRVMIEYNGMYSIDNLMDVIDETDLELYQAIVTVDASTADMYLKNMKSLFMEMFKMADLVIFNRCDDNTNMGSFRRSIKAVNPRAQVGFERADGKEMEQDELLPYDVNAEVIKVEDEDYGIWYIDAMERPQVYEGKTVEMRVQVQRSPKMPPGMIIPGRKAMTCCEDDMTFIGYLCRLNHTKSKTLKRILNNEWVTLTAQIHSEYNEAYDKTMPILTAIRIEKSEPPKEQLVYFQILKLGQEIKMQRNLTKGPITVNLLLFALPLMFGNLLQQLYNVADTWVVGRYLGANAFAAAVKIDSFAYMPVQDFGNAFSTYVAQNYGAKEEKRIKGNLDVGLSFCFRFL